MSRIAQLPKEYSKRSAQCHVLAQSPPGRYPKDKYPVNTSHRSDLCKNISLQCYLVPTVIHTVYAQSYIYTYIYIHACVRMYIHTYAHKHTHIYNIYIYNSQYGDAGRKNEIKTGTTVIAACRRPVRHSALHCLRYTFQ
jgi:hypothetical protein